MTILIREYGKWYMNSDITRTQWDPSFSYILEKIRFTKDPDVIELLKGPILIGKIKGKSHILLDSSTVSFDECALEKHFLGYWFLRLRHPQNDVYIEREKLVRRVIASEDLQPNDKIHLGSAGNLKSPYRVTLRIQ